MERARPTALRRLPEHRLTNVFVGGDEPCVVLMIGARPEQHALRYPVSEVAARHRASASKERSRGDEAYADWPGEYEPARVPWSIGPTG